METTIIKKDSVDNKTFVLVKEEESVLDVENNIADVYFKDFKIKLEVKVLWFKFYITIKTFTPDDFLSKEDIDFAKAEAEELFNNIINPYKYHGKF